LVNVIYDILGNSYYNIEIGKIKFKKIIQLGSQQELLDQLYVFCGLIGRKVSNEYYTTDSMLKMQQIGGMINAELGTFW
jgi:hypothetical protein